MFLSLAFPSCEMNTLNLKISNETQISRRYKASIFLILTKCRSIFSTNLPQSRGINSVLKMGRFLRHQTAVTDSPENTGASSNCKTWNLWQQTTRGNSGKSQPLPTQNGSKLHSLPKSYIFMIFHTNN